MLRGATTALLLAACVPVWIGSAWVLDLVGLGELDLLGRAVLVVLFLSLAEALLTRVGAQPR
jgi:hypothetical protein